WRCNRCGRVVRTAGRVTSQRCGCQGDGAWMELLPPVKREPFRPPPRVPEEAESNECDTEPAVDASTSVMVDTAASAASLDVATAIEIVAALPPPSPEVAAIVAVEVVVATPIEAVPEATAAETEQSARVEPPATA